MPIKKQDDETTRLERRKIEVLQKLLKANVPAGRIHPNSTLAVLIVEIILTHDEFKNLASKIIEAGGSIREFQRYNKSQYLYIVNFYMDERDPGLHEDVMVTSLGLRGRITFISTTYQVQLHDSGEYVEVSREELLP